MCAQVVNSINISLAVGNELYYHTRRMENLYMYLTMLWNTLAVGAVTVLSLYYLLYPSVNN